MLQSIFSSARREGLISTNPAEALELPETRLPVERGTFTPEQVRLVILAARKIADKMRTLFPADLGFLVYNRSMLIDFSSRHFDTIEFDRMIALSEQLLQHLPEPSAR